MDPRCSPPRVFLAHPSDQIAQLSIDLWPPCPLALFPTPKRRETRTMPAKDGLRLNDMRRIEQARPEPGQPHHQSPVTAAQSKARWRPPQGDAELMAKEQILDFKSARRLEEVDSEHCELMQNREQCPRSCDDSTRRCDSQAGWNFRKAQARLCAEIRRCRAAAAADRLGFHLAQAVGAALQWSWPQVRIVVPL